MDKFEIGDKVNFVVERSLLSGIITKFYKNPYGEEECSIKTEIKTFPHILLQRVKKINKEDDLISKIADLEARLAESEEFTQGYRKECAKIQSENVELKQQLAKKDAEIENLKENSLSKRIFKEKLIPSHCIKQYEKYEQQIDKLTQDKISFCIEHINRFKDFILNNIYLTNNGDEERINKYFDNQIEQLKKRNI